MSRRINVLDAVLLFPALPPTRPRPRWQCHPASAPVTTSDRNLRSLIERVEHVLAGHGSVSFTLDQYGQLYPNSNETFLSKLNAATASIAPAGADDAIYDKVVARQRPRGVAGLLGHVLHPSRACRGSGATRATLRSCPRPPGGRQATWTRPPAGMRHRPRPASRWCSSSASRSSGWRPITDRDDDVGPTARLRRPDAVVREHADVVRYPVEPVAPGVERVMWPSGTRCSTALRTRAACRPPLIVQLRRVAMVR